MLPAAPVLLFLLPTEMRGGQAVVGGLAGWPGGTLAGRAVVGPLATALTATFIRALEQTATFKRLLD